MSVPGITDGIPPENVRIIEDAVILYVSIDFDPNAFGGTVTLVPDEDWHVHHYVPRREGRTRQGEPVSALVCECGHRQGQP